MFLLAFFIYVQPLAALQRKHTRDWTICSWSAYAGSLALQSQQQTCPLATDWSLWSYQPIFPEPVEGDYDSEPFPADCVFTFAAFRGNQGISLITSPQLAASLADQLDDSRMSPRLRDQLAHTSQRQQNDKVAYDVREVPGRGKGVLAKRKFTRHETVMVGFPVLVVRLDFINGDRYSARQKRRMMEASVKQLPPEQEESIRCLARNTGGEPILDALRTNGFGIEIDGIQHLALFTDGSRVNHNCRPNSYWRYVNGDIAMEVVALREIQPGQEVAHSYAPLGYTYEQRKAILQAWGFQCRCALCSGSLEVRNASDRRRERLLEIHQTLSQAERLGGKRVGQLVAEAMGLIEQEELRPQLVEYYQQFAKAYLMVNDLRRARAFVTETDKMWTLYGGEQHENIDGMRELWQTLEEAERDAEVD
ncbi:hypothetical protein B0I37DRAFT_341273 [Chaetomium sp. MPI-CAGE-AT-0009]|nr:hypothetical protein B0I37DRAFT_341273 [Chaetomium sp. MPI-CAGE-AT-0009]